MAKENKKKIQVMPKPRSSPASEYAVPILQKVATQIEADDPIFLPKEAESFWADLKANLSDRETLAINMPNRAIQVVDCGLRIELPKGFMAVVLPKPNLASRGLLVANYKTNGRISVTLINCGHQIVTISHGDVIAQMAVQPAYLCQWGGR